MYHLLEFFHSEHDDYILDVYLQILQAWLAVEPPSKCYTVSNALFHKYGGVNVAVTNFMSHFSIFPQPMPLWNWPMEAQDMPKELGLFYVAFLTVRLYIQLGQFIIVQVTLPTLYHQVPSSFILVKKGYILTSLTLWLCWPSRLFLEITIPESQQSWLSSTQNCQDQSSQRQ